MTTLHADNSFLYDSANEDYFTWTRSVYIDNCVNYENLLNWLSGEFSLYLQEESESLKVYFPNGWFDYEKIKGSIEIRIVIKSKCQICGNKVKSQLESIMNHFNRFISHC